MMFGWIIIIGLLVYMVVQGESTIPSRKTGLNRLNERLVKGDITIEEYQRIKQQLEE